MPRNHVKTTPADSGRRGPLVNTLYGTVRPYRHGGSLPLPCCKTLLVHGIGPLPRYPLAPSMTVIRLRSESYRFELPPHSLSHMHSSSRPLGHLQVLVALSFHRETAKPFSARLPNLVLFTFWGPLRSGCAPVRARVVRCHVLAACSPAPCTRAAFPPWRFGSESGPLR